MYWDARGQNDKYTQIHGQQNDKYTQMHGQQNVRNCSYMFRSTTIIMESSLEPS